LKKDGNGIRAKKTTIENHEKKKKQWKHDQSNTFLKSKMKSYDDEIEYREDRL